VEKTKNFNGELDNVDVERVPGISHVSIDKNEVIQQKVIAAIDAAVASGPSIDPAAPKPPGAPGAPAPAVTTPPPPASAKRAAAAPSAVANTKRAAN
jgi:hypothetical protein